MPRAPASRTIENAQTLFVEKAMPGLLLAAESAFKQPKRSAHFFGDEAGDFWKNHSLPQS
jgi:hypothetical protein